MRDAAGWGPRAALWLGTLYCYSCPPHRVGQGGTVKRRWVKMKQIECSDSPSVLRPGPVLPSLLLFSGTHSGTETIIARMTITAIHRNSSVIGSKTDRSFVLPSISRCAAIPSRSPSKNLSTARINLMQFPLARSISHGTSKKEVVFKAHSYGKSASGSLL